MSPAEEIAIKATSLLEEIAKTTKDSNIKILELEARIKNVELTNRLLISELRKSKFPKDEKEQKTDKPQPQSSEIDSSSVPVGFVTQKFLWSDKTPIRLAYVDLMASSGNYRKKITTGPNGSWQIKDLPFGEYNLLLTKEPTGDKPALNYKVSFTFTTSPLDLGTLEIKI